MKNKKLDIFNFFYSFAAVIILIGVIAKLLEWPSQDILITLGLSIEAVVFGVSAIKFKEVDVKENEIQENEQNSDQLTVGDENKKLTGSDSLEKLERFLKISNNLVFENNWEKLDKQSYSDLSKFLLRIFGIKIPDRESLTFLKDFPIKLPPLNAETLTPKGELPVSTDEIKLFLNILDRSNLENVMENIIFLEKKNCFYIRSKKNNEIPIFGGLSSNILAHSVKYFSNKLIISPDIESLKRYIHFNENRLIEYIIENSNFSNQEELNSLILLTKSKNDLYKFILLDTIKPSVYNSNSKNDIKKLSLLVKLISFTDNKDKAKEIFINKVSFINKNKKSFKITDAINYNFKTIDFGPQNEFKLLVKEIFSSEELSRIETLNKISADLIKNKIGAASVISNLFGSNDFDTKHTLYDKLNKSLKENKITPEGTQLLYLLLYKQFNIISK
jgi:hypothetical protein